MAGCVRKFSPISLGLHPATLSSPSFQLWLNQLENHYAKQGRPTSTPTMRQTVLNQAKAWGFVCQEDTQNSWLIFPQKPKERWKLKSVEDRWLLIIGDVPQVHLHPHEAIAFLERRRR